MRIFLFILLTLIVFFAAGCRPEAPGEGSAHTEGSKVSKPIIAALEKYKKDNGKYPANLDELVPKYVPANPQRAKAQPSNKNGGLETEIFYEYTPRKDGKEFSFNFSYWNFFWKDDCNYESERKFSVCGSQPPGGYPPAETADTEKSNEP